MKGLEVTDIVYVDAENRIEGGPGGEAAVRC
jgi:hypothetical protein